MTGTQAPEIPQIQTTKNYSQFKLMKGNRDVDYNHVKRLKREFEAAPHLMPARPVIVNEHGYIIEGQHSRQAAQELDRPMYFIVIPGATVTDTRHLNVTQKRWTLLDFARSYADSGRQDYKVFLETYRQFPNIAPSIIRTYLAGGQRHQLDLDFRRGEFQTENEADATGHIKMLNAVIEKTGAKINSPMATSLLRMFKDTKIFDYTVFMSKLEKEGAREMFRPAASVRACMRSIEDVYNFQSKVQKRLY